MYVCMYVNSLSSFKYENKIHLIPLHIAPAFESSIGEEKVQSDQLVFALKAVPKYFCSPF